MTLFEIADVLWQRGENEAYNALVKHTREYTTLVECGLTLLSRDIAKQAMRYERLTDLDIDPMIGTDEDYSPCVPTLTEEQIRWRIQVGLDCALGEDSPLLNMESWQEAERRVAALPGLSDRERGVRVWSTYTYIIEGGDEEAELQLDDDRWAEAYMRASAFTSVTSDDYPVISRGYYEQLVKEGWHAA